jgi:reductive dehalogenase
MYGFIILANSLTNLLLIVTGVLLFLIMISFSIVFLLENEYRAAKIAFIASLFVASPFILLSLMQFAHKDVIAFVLLFVTYAAVLVLFIPIRFSKNEFFSEPTDKHDERDIMFSRNELIPNTEKYTQYYSLNPDKKVLDDNFREKPGLLSPESIFYHTLAYASANANLTVIEALKPCVDGAVAEKKQVVDAEKISKYIKTWSAKLGAHSTGITILKDYHLYSHKGRKELYGKQITNQHKFAIAFTLEMDNDLISTAPKGPVIMESTQQYLKSGTIALQIAGFIRELGYSARAHIDGNYELICPLVARDAGLGEIGRMGLLITPKLGPRVRLAVVTTDIPLIADTKSDFSSVIDFCTICKKCANVCPSQSISVEDREKINNTLRWKINSESCFTYWCNAGTDCGRCIAVCPYSHPNNVMHNIIRRGIHNSSLFQRLALFMDNMFYGKKPKSRKIPSWIDN